MTLTKMWLKSLVRFPLDLRRAEACLRQRPQPRETVTYDRRAVVLEMTTPQLQFDCGRHLNALAIHTRMIGSPFYVRCSRVLLAAMARKLFGRDLLLDTNFHWLRPDEPLPENAVVLRDGVTRPTLCGDGGSHSHARLMIGRDCVPGADVMPYPMHPHTLARLPAVDLPSLRQIPHPRGIFFAGRLKTNYVNVRNRFGVMNRLEMIQCLRENFADRVRNRFDVHESEQSITLVDAKTQGLSSEEWLPTLARHAFFVGCPGVCQPMCHNVIEAMSVGTIPILEYGDRFTPELSDGVHAICFQGPEGLVDAVRRIDRMTAFEIQHMRGQVSAYYEEHLRGDRFLAEIRDRAPGSHDMLISMPFHDVNFFQAGQQRAA